MKHSSITIQTAPITFSWSTVTLGTYAAVNALARATVSDAMQRDVSLLSMLTGKNEEYFMDLPLTELGKLRKAMHDFLNAPIEEKYIPEFECNGRKYKVSETLEEFSGAILEGISALQLNDENYPEKAHIVTAMLCKEVPSETLQRKKGLLFWKKEMVQKPILNVHERAKDFEEHLPTSIALGINEFFFACSQELYPVVLEKIKKDTLNLQAMMKRKGQNRTSAKRK